MLNGVSTLDDLNDCSGVSKRRIVEKTFRAGMRPPSLKHNARSFIKLGVLNRHKRSVHSMVSAVQLLISAICMLLLNSLHVFFNHCTVYFYIYKVHTPTNALFIKLDKVLKFTLKITLTCSYMFRSTTVIREPSLEPS